MPSSTKRCSKCNQEKSLTDFHVYKLASDGKNSWCKVCVSEYSKRHYAEHPERVKAYSRQYWRDHKAEIKIKKAIFYQKNKVSIARKHNEWYLKNKNTDRYKEYQRVKAKRWRETNREKSLEVYKRHNRKVRLQALQMISGLEVPECYMCGCNDLRVLEVNHKNGGGSQEYKSLRKKGRTIYFVIVKGYRKVDDLEILCKVCNAIHYVEQRFGLKYRVEFLREGERIIMVKNVIRS